MSMNLYPREKFIDSKTGSANETSERSFGDFLRIRYGERDYSPFL